MLRVWLEFRGVFDDQREYFILGYRCSRFTGCLIAPYVWDAAPMREDLQDGNFPGVWNLREELVEGVGQLQFSFLDKLQNHHGGERFCDRSDPESARRSQRFLFGSVDLAVADGAGVKNRAVLGNDEAPHRLIPFGKPVKKLVEFGFVQRLRVARGEQRQRQQGCE